MPVIVNPYKSAGNPLGDAIERAAKSMYGDTLTPALKREQLYGAQRENVETDALMNAVAANGDLDWSVIAPAIVGSGYNPGQFNDLMLGRAANVYGARDQRTQNAQIGAGKPFAATAEAFDIGDATDRRGQDIASSDRRYGIDVDDSRLREQFNQKPIEASIGGQSVFVPQGGAFDEGVSPLLSSGEQSPAIKFNSFYDLYNSQNSADPNNPTPEEASAAKNYAMAQVSKSAGRRITVGEDGTVSIEEGGIGTPTNNVRSGLQKQAIETAQFSRLADLADKYLTDPGNANLFGVVGQARQYAQGAVEAGNTLASSLGYNNPEEMTQSLRGEAYKSGVANLLPELYDPNLDAVDAVWGMLVYKGAAAMAGQEGRSISDKDVAFFRQVFGDPKSFFASQKSMKAKLDIARQITGGNQDVVRGALNGGALGGGDTINGAPVQGDTQQAGPGLTAETAIEITSEAEADKLPPGTWVRMNGKVGKVR